MNNISSNDPVFFMFVSPLVFSAAYAAGPGALSLNAVLFSLRF